MNRNMPLSPDGAVRGDGRAPFSRRARYERHDPFLYSNKSSMRASENAASCSTKTLSLCVHPSVLEFALSATSHTRRRSLLVFSPPALTAVSVSNRRCVAKKKIIISDTILKLAGQCYSKSWMCLQEREKGTPIIEKLQELQLILVLEKLLLSLTQEECKKRLSVSNID